MSGSISSPAETEKWALDPLGNWTTYQFDGDGDGNFTSGADLNDARSYDSPAGLANEITEWDPYPANSQNNPVEPVYDAAGNMTDDNYQYVYTYDAWNRLVKVEDQGVTRAVIGAYAYDGLNRRITSTIGSDDAIHEYYTESWQRIESRPGGESSTQGVSLFVFGIRYIDDIVMRQRDANGSGPPEERRYFLTDANYNVSMLVTDSGYGVERIFYTAYGEPEVFPFGDADGDYSVVDPTDKDLMIAIKDGQAPYNILADLNLDGAVTQADVNAFGNYAGYSGGRGVLAISNGSATTGNDIGYAGYTWNDERSQWHVRHREYDPKMGRFLQRDPVGHSSGSNFYQYADGSAATLTDAGGLSPFPPSVIPAWTLPNFTENGTDMASEPPPPTYWGMLLGPGFDPSWLDWGGNPFEGIFNPLIAPGFDPSQFCKQPGPQYWAGPPRLPLPNDADPIDRALDRTGGRAFSGWQVPGPGGWSGLSAETEYATCVAGCMALKTAEILARAAAYRVFGKIKVKGLIPTMAHEFRPGIPLDPGESLFDPNFDPLWRLPGRKTIRHVFERYPGPAPALTGKLVSGLRFLGDYMPYISDARLAWKTLKALAKAKKECEAECSEKYLGGGRLVAQ